MKTSGVDEPPEISVASVARLVSVFVGADVSVTWMFGYTLLKAAISTVRVSPCALVVIGLADHTIEPDVALPAAADVAVDTGVLLLLLLLLLLQPATASAPTAPAMAASCQLLRRDEYPANLCRAIYAPLARD